MIGSYQDLISFAGFEPKKYLEENGFCYGSIYTAAIGECWAKFAALSRIPTQL